MPFTTLPASERCFLNSCFLSASIRLRRLSLTRACPRNLLACDLHSVCASGLRTCKAWTVSCKAAALAFASAASAYAIAALTSPARTAASNKLHFLDFSSNIREFSCNNRDCSSIARDFSANSRCSLRVNSSKSWFAEESTGPFESKELGQLSCETETELGAVLSCADSLSGGGLLGY